MGELEKKLNIAFWVPDDPNTNSGGYEYDRRLASVLLEQGHRVEFVGPHRSLGISEGFDLVLVDELGHRHFSFSVLVRNNGKPMPLVAVVHHLKGLERRAPWQNAVHLLRERRFLRRADAVIVNSATTLKSVLDLTRKAPILGQLVLPPGLERKHIRAPSVFVERGTILSVGTVTKHKGYLSLARALQKLKALPWRWTLVGDLTVEPRTVKKLVRLVHRMGWEERVIFAGWVNEDDLERYWSRSEIFALPASYEGYGMACLQAMARGLAVVSGDRGGIREIVSPGHTGFLVGSQRQLVRTLQRCLSDSSLVQAVAHNARKEAAAHPDWATALHHAGAFLEGVVENYRRLH